MQVSEIQRRLTELGANAAHRDRVLRHWVQAIPLSQGRRAL